MVKRSFFYAVLSGRQSMGLLNLLLQDPLAFFLIAIPLLYSIIFHELAHGWVAYRMGDPTARSLGRLSLNPLKHLDPMGTIMLFVFGFGWAKPVPVNFNRLRDRHKGMIWVSAAGIITNMLLAFVCSFFESAAVPFSLKHACGASLLSGADQHHPGRF